MSSVNIDGFDDERLVWFNNPTTWCKPGPTAEKNDALKPGLTEGLGGSFIISGDGKELSMTPPAFKDCWARTFYKPLLIKHDLSALVCTLNKDEEFTTDIEFEFTPKSQFDQAGLFVYLDDQHWIKFGIEYFDGSAKLSAVVTNIYSDWSTQVWDGFGARLRVHKIAQSNSVVLEAAPLLVSSSSTTANSLHPGYQTIRIAHISARACHGGEDLTEVEKAGKSNELDWKIGPFAACPTKQIGNIATFRNFNVGQKLPTLHKQLLS
mmetsp:Transcript_1275/g.2072  ORF Transcript_1275/g.2072 Transcript_1275/m.2072 type:complete len:265 (-) Transcript_1275:234-1028(-)